MPEIVRDVLSLRVFLLFPCFQMFFLASWAADGVKTWLKTATSTQDYSYTWNLRWQNFRLFLCDLSHPIHFLSVFILKIWIYLFHQVQLKSPHLSIVCSTVVCSERLPATLDVFKVRSQSLLPGFVLPLTCVASLLLLMWCCHGCSLNRQVGENRIPDPACHCAPSTHDSACYT